MTTLRINGSSSSGNSYILDCNGKKLLVELGVPWKEILKSLEYDVNNICGALVSHTHTDHFYTPTVDKALLYGIKTYSTPTAHTLNNGIVALQPKKRYKIGDFIVLPLEVPHNAECYSYVIDLPDNEGRLLFITDAGQYPYVIRNVNYLMVETNYSDDVLFEHTINAEAINPNTYNHLSLQQALEVTDKLYNGGLAKIICLHLSDNNSDEAKVKKSFKDEFGVDVVVADKNISVPLCRYNF